MKNSFIYSQLKSFGPAFAGIRVFFFSEPNAIIHLFATIVVIVLAFGLKVNNTESIFLAFAVGMVWVAELFNTAIEKTMDFISEENHPKIKFVKDVAAGAVLIAAFTAATTGLIIFIPKIFL